MNKKKADKYSKEFIIADGHIDLPYRLYKEGLLYEKNINLNRETIGNFDIPKAEKGGLNCPFMAIYIPSEKLEDEAFAFANDLIDLVRNLGSSLLLVIFVPDLLVPMLEIGNKILHK